MRNNIFKLKLLVPVLALTALASSCKYQDVGDANYEAQKIYMPAAAQASGEDSGNGIYLVNQIAEANGTYRYIVNPATGQRKFIIPLGVYRSGVNTDGAVNVEATLKNSVLTEPAISGKLPVGTVVLPTAQYTLEPASVTIASGKDFAGFNLTVNLDFLLANATQKYAVAVTVASPNVASNPKLNTTVVMLDPNFLTLVPTANFSAAVPRIDVRDVKFNNTSTNGARYKWDFGDGTPTSDLMGPVHTYAASGTYNVTLTTYGALGEENKTSVTKSVVVPVPVL